MWSSALTGSSVAWPVVVPVAVAGTEEEATGAPAEVVEVGTVGGTDEGAAVRDDSWTADMLFVMGSVGVFAMCRKRCKDQQDARLEITRAVACPAPTAASPLAGMTQSQQLVPA